MASHYIQIIFSSFFSFICSFCFIWLGIAFYEKRKSLWVRNTKDDIWYKNCLTFFTVTSHCRTSRLFRLWLGFGFFHSGANIWMGRTPLNIPCHFSWPYTGSLSAYVHSNFIVFPCPKREDKKKINKKIQTTDQNQLYKKQTAKTKWNWINFYCLICKPQKGTAAAKTTERATNKLSWKQFDKVLRLKWI